MDKAVSSAAAFQRIQTIPEIQPNNTGPDPLTHPRRTAGRAATYRTWPVFSFALLALLGLMLVPAITALRRSEAIYDEIGAGQEQFEKTQRVFEGLSQNVFTISLTIREFLLDPSPDAGPRYRTRLNGARKNLQDDIARLEQIL